MNIPITKQEITYHLNDLGDRIKTSVKDSDKKGSNECDFK